MDENIVKFEEKLKELVALGKKKKSILEVQEINDFFADMELDADQMEKVFDYLEAHNIDVLRMTSDGTDIDDLDDLDVDLMIAEKKETWKSIWRRSTCLCRMGSASKIRCVCI